MSLSTQLHVTTLNHISWHCAPSHVLIYS